MRVIIQPPSAIFRRRRKTDPNAVYGATLRLGILTYVGQTQYPHGALC